MTLCVAAVRMEENLICRVLNVDANMQMKSSRYCVNTNDY